MKPTFFSLATLALLAFPLAARAHTNPDFDDDAKPILRMQPGLLEYVEARFEVKDTGTAKYPGDDDRRPGPPFIFRARPAGSSGPYNFRLLIQPGAPGHILGVVDMTKVHLHAPAEPPQVANQQPPEQQTPPPTSTSQAPAPQPPAQEPAPQEPAASSQAPAQQPNEPTADTPSGPIMGPDSSSSSQPSLAPPPDPAPATGTH